MFNFEDFMGGHPGMGGRRGPPKEVDNKKYYELLGVEKTATMDQIKKAYRRKAMKEHPDKGGDPEKWQEITAAQAVLTDKDKRDVYDQYGEDGIKEGRGNHTGMDLGSMFGFGGGGRRQAGPQKGKSVKHAIKVTLEDVYKGKTSKIAVNRDRICKECDGKGGKNGANSTCESCRGRGMVTRMVQLGPGMYSQSTGPCGDCGGTGEQISEKDKCKACNGKKVVKEKKVIECIIDKGSPHGEVYTFHGESDEHPDKEPGDVLIVVDEQPHKIFKRKGADLFFEKEISLLESLTGCDFMIKHVDGSMMRIQSPPGLVVKPDQLMTLEGKGLPFHKTPYQFGNLFVLFSVKFPDSLTDDQIGQVGTTLSAMKKHRPDENMEVAETVTLQKFSESQKNTHAQGGTRGNDSDEEEDDPRMRGGGQRMECKQQ